MTTQAPARSPRRLTTPALAGPPHHRRHPAGRRRGGRRRAGGGGELADRAHLVGRPAARGRDGAERRRPRADWTSTWGPRADGTSAPGPTRSGRTVNASLQPGELVPAAALGDPPAGRIVVVPVPADKFPPGVDHGSVIDLYLTKESLSRRHHQRRHRPAGRRSHRPVGHRAVLRRAVRSLRHPVPGRRPGGRSDSRRTRPHPSRRARPWWSWWPGHEQPTPGVVTAGSGQPWESELVTALERPGAPLTVVRRCADIGEVLATAATGRARIAVVDGSLRRFDTEAVQRLRSSGVAVVGVFASGDARSRARLERLGVSSLVGDTDGTETLLAAARQAVDGPEQPAPPTAATADPSRALPPSLPPPPVEPTPGEPVRPPGRLRRRLGTDRCPRPVHGGRGPGRRARRRRTDTLLIDADVYGGVLASAFGILDESPGLAGACRVAANGRLTPPISTASAGRSARSCGCSPASPARTAGPRCARRRSRRCWPPPGNWPRSRWWTAVSPSRPTRS